jgi:gluconolactonase
MAHADDEFESLIMKTALPLTFCFLARRLFLPALFTVIYSANLSAQMPPKGSVYEPEIPIESNDYTPGPDSQIQAGVPAGKIFKFDLIDSKIFPGTTRTITVYIPAAYTPKNPACLYVGLDDLSWNAPVVFDNLIAQHAMPVTIGIGIAPGAVRSANREENPRFDRSFEFDSRSDRLARFILEEVVPEVTRQKTPLGDPIVISTDPNDRAIGGSSTGGIGSFTVAWEHPDAFRRVFISIGTFVGMRGGEQYYVQVRKTEPKPIRIFQQDGVHDEWPGGPEMGDWWMSNLTMNRALEFAGYDVKHVWGDGTHNGNQAKQVFPDAMRWLWRDYPTPIQAQAPGNPRLREILQPGETWQLAGPGCQSATNLAADRQGRVFFRSAGAPDLSELATDPKPASCVALTQAGSSLAFGFGPGDKRYLARARGGIMISTPTQSADRVVAGGLVVRDFTVRNNGDIYATTQVSNGLTELWLINTKGEKVRLDDGIKGASGLAFSPDGLWLFVAQSLSHTGLSYRVLSDGRLDARESFYDFYVPTTADNSGAGGIVMDRNGLAYVATRIGVQIFDRNGRVIAILPMPGNEAITSVSFGGQNYDTLYAATANGKIYKRRLRAHGVLPFAAPTKLPAGSAG